MQIRQTLGCKALLLLVAFTVLIAGCSRINLAYRNLDTLIPWWIDDYLDLDREQQKRFRAQLRDHLSWHCQTQLPAYLDTLGQLQHQVRRNEINEATLRVHYQDAKQAIRTIAREATPTFTQLLRDLDDGQVKTLNEALEKDRREREEKYLQPPLDRQISERAERMGERFEHWLGTLNAAQRQRILAWAHNLGEQNRLWLDNRVKWQRALSAAVAQRHEAGFEERIAKTAARRRSLLDRRVPSGVRRHRTGRPGACQRPVCDGRCRPATPPRQAAGKHAQGSGLAGLLAGIALSASRATRRPSR